MKKDMVYIGVRTYNGPLNEDSYMGSSTHKDMKDGLKNRPDDFVKFILRIFDTRDEANQHEIDLHEEYDVAANPRFYNKVKSTSTGFDTTGIKHTEEACKKISASRKGKPPWNKDKKLSQETRKKMSAAKKDKKHTQEARDKMSAAKKDKKLSQAHRDKIGAAQKGKKLSQETCDKISTTLKGKKLSQDHKDKMSAAHKDIKLGPQKIVTCPHCGKSGGICLMNRWHFDNCKRK
jgi:hypothetical protein